MSTAADRAKREVERAYAEMVAIRGDVNDGEWDCARAHIEMLKRRLATLDEKLLEAVAVDVDDDIARQIVEGEWRHA